MFRKNNWLIYRKNFSHNYYRQKLVSIFSLVVIIIEILFLAWVALSYLEIISHNLDMQGYEYCKFNFFKLLY